MQNRASGFGWRSSLKLLALALTVVMSSCAIYALAAVGFALAPASGRPQLAADAEPLVYVCASLAHTDIVLPLDDPLTDWRAIFPEVATTALPPNTYLAFGWGDLRFFQETPQWSDLKVSTASAAFLGLHPTALRVLAIRAPAAGEADCPQLALDREGRKALIQHIRETLDLGPGGQAQLQPGGGRFEAYYLARGRYSPMRTCNQWVAEGFAAAGLPHARFAPFSFSVLWPLEKR